MSSDEETDWQAVIEDIRKRSLTAPTHRTPLVVHPSTYQDAIDAGVGPEMLMMTEHIHKILHSPIKQNGRLICSCGDYDCASLDVLRENPQNKNPDPRFL